MKHTLLAAALALAYPLPTLADHTTDPATSSEAPTPSLGVVTVTASRPTSLPTHIPTTVVGSTREDIARTVNATDSEDALKYFPSLLVRKRYIGDYNHAILSSRASGTGNSARSAVYADGILLSNYLGNGVSGLSFPPRWGLVTPEEIERVDVMYGPFSAAYPGNSAGAVVDYVTRMPSKLEAHTKVGYVNQPFELYGHADTYRAWQVSASLGSREGDWSWWLSLNRTDSEGQPLTFANRLVSAGSTPSGSATTVNGAVLEPNSANAPWYLLGSGTRYHTRQDHLKAKLAYELSPTLRASYVMGAWQNTSDGHAESWLRDSQGRAVYSGAVRVDGRGYTLNGGDFAITHENLQHVMHGLSLKTHGRGEWNWEVAASRYDYVKDDKRQNGSANPLPAALSGGPGTLADGSGTGWTQAALKGIWRPGGVWRDHLVDMGYQLDDYELRYRTLTLTGNYLRDETGPLASGVRGQTRMHSVYAQDSWRIAPAWRTVWGLRVEHWQAQNGRTDFSAGSGTDHPARSVTQASPKAAVSWQWLPDTVLKLSVGRAVRMPTVGELYGATSTINSQYINDPMLKPEKSWTAELTAEQALHDGRLRLTAFAEDTRDGIYSQTLSVYTGSGYTNVSRVQNVGRVATQGIEAAFQREDWLVRGLDLQGSVTYTESIIKANDGYVSTPGDTIGKWQPNIPRWRATAVAAYRFNERATGILAVRYSGKQYRTLNNADDNGYAYMGVSPYTTADVRLRYRITKQWHAAFGVDNLNNDKYWNFHPYPQRSYTAELSFDL
jgi:iron complex outermembrane receptor protein